MKENPGQTYLYSNQLTAVSRLWPVAIRSSFEQLRTYELPAQSYIFHRSAPKNHRMS